jgi:hypothetical protein
VLVGAAVCGVVLAGAAPKSDGPDEAGVGAALGSSFFCPKLKPPVRGVVVPLCAGAAFPKRLPPVFCAPPFTAGAPPPKRPPLEACGVVLAPPNRLFGCSPVEAAGFAPPKSPPLEAWGVVVPLPLPNVLFCWPPLAAAFPKRPPPDGAGVLLPLPNSPPPDEGVAAPPKSDLFCCWLLEELLLFAPADPKLNAIVSARKWCCVLCCAGMRVCMRRMPGSGGVAVADAGVAKRKSKHLTRAQRATSSTGRRFVHSLTIAGITIVDSIPDTEGTIALEIIERF